MANITFNNIPESEIQTAIVRVIHFSGQYPDRVGSPNCCIYGVMDQNCTTMSVHRTPKGRLVVNGLAEKEPK
jgi:allantoicase